MKAERVPTKNLKAGDFIRRQTFLISDVRELTTKAGKLYASFMAGDKTGAIPCVCWDILTIAVAWDGPAGSLMAPGLKDLTGDITEYNGKLQFKVTGIYPPSDQDLSLFERRSEFDECEMWAQFLEFAVKKYSSPKISQLSCQIIDKYAEQFMTKPAATGMHHAFKHGLLEHTLQMLQTAEKLFELPFYAKSLNKDYCMFGIMFHDFGKIFEYGDAPDFKRTVSGILVSHIPRMAAIIEKEAYIMGMDEELMLYLQSIVLSHHRFQEWGSPVKPATPEALFVHYVDNLHGDVFGVLQKLEGDTTSDPVVKHGFGDSAYVIVKKRFSEVVSKEKLDEKARVTNPPPREEVDLVGF